MHFRAAQDTCVRCQVVFQTIPVAQGFFEEIAAREDIFFPSISAGMVFFLAFDESLARKLANDYERRWLEGLLNDPPTPESRKRIHPRSSPVTSTE